MVAPSAIHRKSDTDGMPTLAYLLAALMLLGAARSGYYWLSRGLPEQSGTEFLWWALFVTSRVGLWLCAGTVCVIAALAPAPGKSFAGELSANRWFILVPLVLAILQILSAFFLSRVKGPAGEEDSAEEGGQLKR